jgi:hypothetical protein
MSTSPLYALSVRQPWAWLIVNGFKDFENRDWRPNYPSRKQAELATALAKPFEVLIHAAWSKDKFDDQQARDTVRIVNEQRSSQGLPLIQLPHFGLLPHGGIVGRASVVAWSDKATDSPWSFRSGLILRDATSLPFQPCDGALGFFLPSF